MELQIQKEEKKKLIFLKVILVAFFVWFLSSLLMTIIYEVDRMKISRALSRGDFLVFLRFLDPVRLSKNPFGIPLTVGLMIGFYLGLRKKGKPLFIYPIISLFVFGIIGIYLVLTIEKPAEAPSFFGLLFFGVITLFVFLFLSFISSIFFYFKKEGLLFKIFIGFLTLLIAGGGIMGKVLSDEFSLEKAKFEKIIKEKTPFLKEEAINQKSPEICEEMERYYEEEKQKIPQGIDVYDASSFFRENYRVCIEEIAITLNDELLCKELEKFFGWGPGSPAGQCQKKVFLQNFEKCKEVEEKLKEDCIRAIALKTRNAEFCRKLYDKDCSDTIAIETNNPEDCYGKYADYECITQIALNNQEVDLCKKITWQRGMINFCIKEVALKIGDPKLCEMIEDSRSREGCYKIFEGR